MHKADRFFEGNRLVILQTDTEADPFHRFVSYLHSRDSLFPALPHLWLREDGTPPTRAWFIKRLRLLFPADVSGHSLCAGGATALALTGVSNDLIQAAGCWSSQAFQGYIRKNPFLLHAPISGSSVESLSASSS